MYLGTAGWSATTRTRLGGTSPPTEWRTEMRRRTQAASGYTARKDDQEFNELNNTSGQKNPESKARRNLGRR